MQEYIAQDELNTLPFSSGTKVKITVREVKEARDIDAETAAYYLSMTSEEARSRGEIGAFFLAKGF